MANTILRIGTRESPLAVWQAQQVQDHLTSQNIQSELVYIKSEGDKDLITPLYALGVQGIFTKALDAALLNNRIDIAVHSMKDVPVQLAEGIKQAAVLKRGNWKDLFIKGEASNVKDEKDENDFIIPDSQFTIATSSIRRIAQWLNKFPNHKIENLRGNVNTRLRKLNESNWNGAIFAAAGLERINLRPENAIELGWMLPAPAQGAIMVVCRKDDKHTFESCQSFNNAETALCTKIERDYLKELMGGCSTPIGAIAEIKSKHIYFKANILSPDGKEKAEMFFNVPISEADELGKIAAKKILKNGGQPILDKLKNAAK
ncbi:MAG: hydroxymethylbilane synthase [Parafilimonas sp.]|nr:hydroxymethylbilane synthase [Parafilimonas sp.]